MRSIIFSLILVSRFSTAEIVKGPAEVRLQDTHRSVLVLYDSVRIDANPAYNGRYLFSISFFLSLREVRLVDSGFSGTSGESVRLKKGTILTDGLIRIGYTLEEFEVVSLWTEGDSVCVQASYLEINQNSIYPDTDVESALGQWINADRLNLSEFRNIERRLSFHSWIDSAGFQTFITYGHVGLAPEMRAILVFRAKQLFAMLLVKRITLRRVTFNESISNLRAYYFSTDKEANMRFRSIYHPIVQNAD
jgi:hypothetical protein